MTRDDLSGDFIEIWPDNLQAFEVFRAISTQWRVGPGGAVGLDYNLLPFVFRLQGIQEERQSDLFEDIRVLENEALVVMQER
ncbi:DUF1799 domain-containing protein [Collimonas sp. NPDC087041]|uniref:DUF1799 domain-containing protein n=1 Tax=Collimonas sp. NPDC087041 TaxID=3363960 RepID=UPI0038139411